MVIRMRRVNGQYRKTYRHTPKYLMRKENGTLYRQSRNNTLKREYGITLDQYNTMFAAQKGCCAICQRHQSLFKKSLHVDHSHENNKVRALLCTICNTHLSIIEDKNWCLKATLYLENYRV